jgi:hypothetical protein
MDRRRFAGPKASAQPRRAAAIDRFATTIRTRPLVSSYLKRRKQRYAEDADFRAKTRDYNRAWHEAHRARVNEARRRQWRDDPARKLKQRTYRRKSQRKDQLKYYYGMSVADYEALLAKQNGACAICKQTFAQTPCVDHSHITGEVRGLLCRSCNLGLGHFKDDPRLTRAATAHLEAALAGEEL